MEEEKIGNGDIEEMVKGEGGQQHDLHDPSNSNHNEIASQIESSSNCIIEERSEDNKNCQNVEEQKEIVVAASEIMQSIEDINTTTYQSEPSELPAGMNNTNQMLAVDVICVYCDDFIFSTEFYVRCFKSEFQMNIFGKSMLLRERYPVEIYCNNKFCTDIPVVFNDQRILEFVENDGTLTASPSSSVLRRFDFQNGRNRVRFVYNNLSAECSVWYWNANDKIAVVDIDGTLTKSDVRGYMETVFLGIYEHIHPGAITFIRALQSEFNMNIMYLTSRPLWHINDTRSLLDNAQENGFPLPAGPVFANKEDIVAAAYRELIAKAGGEFKSLTLINILNVFSLSGAESNPFVFGIGNKETDILAYRMAGISSARAFMVWPNSSITVVVEEDTKPDIARSNTTKTLTFDSYSDTGLLAYLRSVYTPPFAANGKTNLNDMNIPPVNAPLLGKSKSDPTKKGQKKLNTFFPLSKMTDFFNSKYSGEI